MHRGDRRVYEVAHWKDSTKRSWRSHCWEGVQFVESLQSCAQVCSHAPKNENPECESRCRQREGKRSEHCQHGKWRKSWAEKRSSVRHKRGTDSLNCYADGRMPSQEFGVEQIQNYKVRAVRGGDTVKCDSWCSICFTQLKNGGRNFPSQSAQTSEHFYRGPSQCAQTYAYIYHGTCDQNHGPTLRNRLFLLSEIIMVTTLVWYLW